MTYMCLDFCKNALTSTISYKESLPYHLRHTHFPAQCLFWHLAEGGQSQRQNTCGQGEHGAQKALWISPEVTQLECFVALIRTQLR